VGFLVFFYIFSAAKRKGAFLRNGCFCICFLGRFVAGLFGQSRSFFSRLSSRSFPCGCTPTHPFVKATAKNRQSFMLVVQGMTPSFLLRPSRAARPSQSGERSAFYAESRCHFRLDWQARASSLRKGRCIRHCSLRDPSFCSPKFFRESLPPSPSPRPHPFPGRARVKVEGTEPFCRARAEVVKVRPLASIRVFASVAFAAVRPPRKLLRV
jgi:hypothetical protein